MLFAVLAVNNGTQPPCVAATCACVIFCYDSTKFELDKSIDI